MQWQNIQKQLALTNSNLNDPEKEKKVKELGGFQASAIAQILVFMLSTSIIITYVIAVALKQDKPIPHCMITSTAENYPGYLVFRTGMIGAAPFFFLIYIQLFWYVSYLYKKCSIPKHAFTSFIYILTFAIVVLYLITMATIDTGKMNGKLHGTCAVIFFILAQVNFLLIYYHMHVIRKYSGSKYISNENFYIKLFFGATFFVVFGVGLLIMYEKIWSSHVVLSIVEWSITTLLVLQIWTCCWDFKFFRMFVNIQKGQLNCGFVQVEENNMTQALNNYAVVQQPYPCQAQIVHLN